jgi:hypothetical protein
MSLLEKLKEKKSKSGMFAVLAGFRLSGKSTAAGTIPGKTLMLQAKILETGSDSAGELAKKLKNKLDIVSFESLTELVELMTEAKGMDYDTIYIDGLSAVNEMKYFSNDVQKLAKKNIWDSYRELGDSLRRFILFAKELSETKNVIMTMALDPKLDVNGMIVEAKPALKGNVTINEVTRLCPVVISVTTEYDEEGNLVRKFLTKGDGVLPGRIDSILDEDNPSEVPPTFAAIFKLLGK